jgi:O-antigen ligase
VLAVCSVTAVVLLSVLAEFDVRDAADVLLLGRAEHVSTLTGRTELWPELLPYARERLFRGHGYGSFWTADRIEEVSGTVFWGLSSAHSVYLDAVLGVGLVGAGALGLAVLTGLVRAARRYRASEDAGHAFFFALLVYGVLDGCAESAFLSPSFITFVAGCGMAEMAFFHAGPQEERLSS